jgi:hypothetical protein
MQNASSWQRPRMALCSVFLLPPRKHSRWPAINLTLALRSGHGAVGHQAETLPSETEPRGARVSQRRAPAPQTPVPRAPPCASLRPAGAHPEPSASAAGRPSTSRRPARRHGHGTCRVHFRWWRPARASFARSLQNFPPKPSQNQPGPHPLLFLKLTPVI